MKPSPTSIQARELDLNRPLPEGEGLDAVIKSATPSPSGRGRIDLGNLFRISWVRAIWGLIFLIFTALCASSNAATLTNVRYASYPDRVRLVFDFSGQAYYWVASSESALTIALVSCEVSQNIKDKLDINDWVIGDIGLDSSGDDITVNIPLRYPISYNIFPLGAPSRLVVDFGRIFTKTEAGGRITDAIEYKRVVSGGEDGFISAQILKVDPEKADIFPALAQPRTSILGSIVDFLTPWVKKVSKHFYREKVSEIAAQAGAAAAVNGTYFSGSGNPLGVLMMNGDAVSYPISDRTALILTDDGKSYIDNIIMDSYFEYRGAKYEINGINEPRDQAKDIILYTRHYGELTETDRTGFEITVVGGKATDIRMGNSRIPENGYVLSMGSLYAETLSPAIKVGDEIKTVINLIPYSASITGKALHLIGGGPRLIKGGQIYISKHEEKFRPDVAKGRAARTAVGITSDNKLIFVTVDGRPRRKIKKDEGFSMGMSLTELAYFLQSAGAVEALNLDGGGSTTMVINGCVINRPANGYEQSVSNAIIIKPRNTF